MTKAPAFQFYPKDALADTLHLSPEEFTAYWRLVFQAWLGVSGAEQGHLPAADDARLRTMTALTPSQWERGRAGALSLFRHDDVGHLFHKRLVEERGKQLSLREKRSKAGKAGAEAKQRHQQEASKTEANVSSNGPAKSSSPTPISGLLPPGVRNTPPLTPPQGEGRGRSRSKRRESERKPTKAQGYNNYVRTARALLRRALANGDAKPLNSEEAAELGEYLAAFGKSADAESLAWFDARMREVGE